MIAGINYLNTVKQYVEEVNFPTQMATGDNEGNSKEISKFQCFTCTNKAAVKYCLECQGYCCQSCVDTHSRFPSLKCHTLLDQSNSKLNGSSITLPEMPTERCKIHNTKLVDMYCTDHDNVGCTTCMTLKHRSCANVQSISDDIDELFEASILEETNVSLENCRQQIKNIEMKKKVAIEGLNASKKNAETKIDSIKQELIAHIEKVSEEAKEEVESTFQSAKTLLDEEKQHANEKLKELERVAVDLNNSGQNKSQQFVCMKIASKKIKDVKESELALKCNRVAKITFESEWNIQSFIRDTKQLGRASFIFESSNYTVETIKDMNVKLQDDKSTCDIFGSCFIEGGPLLLTDINNKKLKRVNIETMAIDSVCNFKNNPFCVCFTKKDEAVVTFYTYAKFIQFVMLGRELTLARKININHNCLGVSYNGEKLYITDNAHCIYIHDMTGKELQKVSTDNTGNSLFSCVQEIDFSDYLRGVTVIDGKKGVIILNDYYQRIAGYSDLELQNAVSACTDGEGSIFVCGYTSHNVLQVGYDGNKIGNLINESDGIQIPSSVCFDTKKNRLIMTQNNDIVKIIHIM